jgi:hypothetical protein
MASTRRKTLAWDAAASVRFHWVKDVGEQPIDWQNCATGTLDRSNWAIRSAQNAGGFRAREARHR